MFNQKDVDTRKRGRTDERPLCPCINKVKQNSKVMPQNWQPTGAMQFAFLNDLTELQQPFPKEDVRLMCWNQMPLDDRCALMWSDTFRNHQVQNMAHTSS